MSLFQSLKGVVGDGPLDAAAADAEKRKKAADDERLLQEREALNKKNLDEMERQKQFGIEQARGSRPKRPQTMLGGSAPAFPQSGRRLLGY